MRAIYFLLIGANAGAALVNCFILHAAMLRRENVSANIFCVVMCAAGVSFLIGSILP